MNRKATKTEADYRPHVMSQTERCQKCANFRPPYACTKVEGRISPTGWCTYFAKMGATKAAA